MDDQKDKPPNHARQEEGSKVLWGLLNEVGIDGLPAVWLVDLFNLFHDIDDVADGDPCDHRDLVLRACVRIPQNPWYQANIHHLAPVVATQVFKWLAANNLEAAGEHLEKAFMWRAGFYDIVLYVACLQGVIDAPERVAKMYGENLSTYVEEIRCQIQSQL